jgi:ribonuclease HI
MKDIVVYTDGACSGNPGPGGWGAILMFKGATKELSGYESPTTNQRMELCGAIGALQALSEPCQVKLHSDSAYLINAFQQGWLSNWLRTGWRNSKGDDVANRDLWEELLSLSRVHHVEWVKVKGHSDNVHNNRCDELARAAVKQGEQPS